MPNGYTQPIRVTETVTLEKFDTQDSEHVAPTEVIRAVDGRITFHKKGGNVLFDAEQGVDSRPLQRHGTPYHVEDE